MLSQFALEAGTVRASFLQEAGALQDTVAVLTNSGCTESAATVFQEVVRNYYGETFNFSLDKFPKPENGFYSFASPKQLVEALPHRLPETQHSFDFNCMDAVIVLAGDKLQTRLHPDDIVGTILAATTTTNGEGISLAATPRDAFTMICPAWYRQATDSYIPPAMQDSRICLTASLFRWHLLPTSTDKENLEARVVEVLRAAWQRDAIRFPRQFEVVLLHNVHDSAYTICTCHAGLLFPRSAGYTYIEKAGGSGPFVRLDLNDKSDLLPWLATAFTNYTDPHISRFVTFNDGKIKKLNCR